MVNGVYAKDNSVQHKEMAYEAMIKGLWIPAGRIQAGAGTKKTVTMLNCYVSRTIPDSMDGIGDALKDAMLTMQQGGGIGMDFSTLRPSGAKLTRTGDGTEASGPIPFMEMWDAMCATIMSAGSRRGAMMATMDCEHPDLPLFIKAKETAGRLTNFNVSVLVSDAFMQAVEEDEDWYLGCGIPRADGQHLWVTQREDERFQGTWYAYSRYRAKDLWDMIIKHTYEYSEPGVIFIDTVNKQNNLQYIEEIRCTNPCGEQPLPPNGCCNLGAINLARCVMRPFEAEAFIDLEMIKRLVSDVAVRFLDNVIDTTIYPLEAQRDEEFAKRRIGIGITGLADALTQLSIAYNSPDAMRMTRLIMEAIRDAAYHGSAKLAVDRSSFPLWTSEWGQTDLVRALPEATRTMITQTGIRNGVLLTIAPTGTTSIYAGNVSSGLEPVFAHKMNRRVRQAQRDSDGKDTWREYTIYGYNILLYHALRNRGLPLNKRITLEEVYASVENHPWWVTHESLTVRDHLNIQITCQQNVDASISKTINCPEDMEFEEFRNVYLDAYQQGCKGCTTYRPSAVRGSILSAAKPEPEPDSDSDSSVPQSGATTVGKSGVFKLPERPSVLNGLTHRVRWPNEDASYYVTINQDEHNRPFELFINSTSSKYVDWTTALSLMVSAIMRQGLDVDFIPRELRKVISMHDTAWVNGKFYGSLVALIGDVIQQHLELLSTTNIDPETPITVTQEVRIDAHTPHHTEVASLERCSKCGAPGVVRQEGCKICTQCGDSSCS